MAIEVPIPKKRKREEILREAANDVINNETISKLAEVETIAPALISRSIKVISSIDVADNDKAFEKTINNTLKTQRL